MEFVLTGTQKKNIFCPYWEFVFCSGALQSDCNFAIMSFKMLTRWALRDAIYCQARIDLNEKVQNHHFDEIFFPKFQDFHVKNGSSVK